jgi:hypothetical protein
MVVAFLIWVTVLLAMTPPIQADPFAGNSCIARLKTIDGSKARWASEHGKSTNDFPTWADLRPYMSRTGDIPICPAGGGYKIGRVGEPASCAYSHK